MSDLTEPEDRSRRSALCGMVAATLAASLSGAARATSETSNRRIDAGRTALILLDFQRSSNLPALKPYSFDAAIGQAAIATAAMRAGGGLVVHTRVLVDQMLALPADKALPPPPEMPDAAALDPRLRPQPGEPVVTKRQWGAFYATDLDQILRRRGITTLLLAGIATEAAVESTARAAYDAGYALVFLRDAITGLSDDSFGLLMDTLFPLMGRVCYTARLGSLLTPG